MATEPVKSQPLHNFSLSFLKWGGKNQTNTNNRCRRPISGDSSLVTAVLADHNSEAESEPETRSHRVGSRTSRNRFGFSSCYQGDKSQKLLQHLETASNSQTDDEVGGRKRETEEMEAGETMQKPWNLRPRKPMFPKGTFEVGGGASRNGEFRETFLSVTATRSVQQSENPPQPKSLRLRGFSEMQSTERKEKRKFWIALSKDEIEEDIFVMTGSRPSRRPKKRPKIVQKQLDSAFPGLWLVGVSADSYRVTECSSKGRFFFSFSFLSPRLCPSLFSMLKIFILRVAEIDIFKDDGYLISRTKGYRKLAQLVKMLPKLVPATNFLPQPVNWRSAGYNIFCGVYGGF
ncbi:DUF1639 family protein [Quillaja saponaria]|uniref:DUF1639 family protein n=1 Tax=Quillaja saponaria TaxID=32244 RepID=A0AAD7L828_QUISA|nr:DUF1639 family protein [Quillaja saponaria]